MAYKVMQDSQQQPVNRFTRSVADVVRAAQVMQGPNGICYSSVGETKVTPAELDRLIAAVPAAVAAALVRKLFFFVPLTVNAGEDTVIAEKYDVKLSDEAVCHRNLTVGDSQYVFISTRLMEDRFSVAFEFFINVAHAFVDRAGVPDRFATLLTRQVTARVKGETSLDAWELRRVATGTAPRDAAGREDSHEHERGSPFFSHSEGSHSEISRHQADPEAIASEPINGKGYLLGSVCGTRDRSATPSAEVSIVDEKAHSEYLSSAFSDAIAVYMLSLYMDVDYYDLREREYPLLAPPALAERLRAIAELFPPSPGFEFEVRYKRRS